MADCVIVIPLYKQELNPKEEAALLQTIRIFQNYPFVFVTGNTVELKAYFTFFERIKEYKIELFDDGFFKNIEGYNKLLLSDFLYKQFSQYRYMLVCQLDVWVFKDNLAYWCNKGYDYIGAPWINWEWSSFYARHLTFPRRLAYKLGYKRFNLVGNGGFSLRKVSSCINNLKRFKKTASTFTKNEDYFFSFYVTSYNPWFKIPTVKEALKFAFDENPQEAFTLNNNQLPMACHAWVKHEEFWKIYIPEISIVVK